MSFTDVLIGFDEAEFDLVTSEVLVTTEMLMADVQELDAEADEVEQKVKTLEQTSEAANRRILAGARQTAQILRGLAIASGQAINEIFIIGIEVALLTAELLIDVAAAESTTVIGVVSAVARTGQIIALLKKADQLRQGQTEAAARTEGIVSSMGALSQLTYMLIPIFGGELIIRYIFHLLGGLFK